MSKLVIVAGQCYRTGTTLIQRLLNCSNECMVYGEDNMLIPHVHRMLSSAASGHHRSKEQWPSFKRDKNIFASSVNPNWTTRLRVTREMVLNLYNTNGYIYSGFKQIGFRPTDLTLLDELFPEAKIIYCTRPFDEVWQSYSEMYGFQPEEEIRDMYDISVDPAVLDHPQVFHAPYSEDSREQALNILDFLGIDHYDIDPVVNLKLRERDGYKNPVTGEIFYNDELRVNNMVTTTEDDQ